MTRALALGALAVVLAGCGGRGHEETPTAPQQPRQVAPQRRPAPPAPLRLPRRLPARTIVVPILLYHRIDVVRSTLPLITQRLTVSPAGFEEQMRWLERSGYHAVTERQVFLALERGRPLPPRPVLITFDDGYRDVLGKASPVLARLHMPATAYVITGRISGSDPSFLTWSQLRLLEQRGIEIGSHTVDHAPLVELSDQRVRWELVTSRRTLERHLGHPVQWLAYPHGSVDARVVALARRAGYVLATTERPGTLQHASGPLELRRLEVLDTTTLPELAAMLGRVAAQ